MTRRQALALGMFALLAPVACHKKHKKARTPHAPLPTAARPKVGWTQTGVASWYGIPYHGRQAANGEIYDMNELTAAHRTLPFGAIVKVTSAGSNESVTVRITDRGPFVGDRIIDLSRQAARQIDMIGPGIMKVKLQLIAYGPARLTAKAVNQEEAREEQEAPRLSGYAVQVGLFNDKTKAEKLQERLLRHYQPVTLVVREGAHEQWRVLVGDKPTEEEAEALAVVLRKQVGEALVVLRD
ncbi:MAG: septal ring lytic transglycosylase RlpA family protein [Bryobacteraceae bacterium]|nr:septal ring lytic transglycosylase RlpA family protein [Bryobacteraceae bacterium]